jgi:hypothetical protein
VEQLEGESQLKMKSIWTSLDASSKRWLVLFALATISTVGVLVHSFFSAVAPPNGFVGRPQRSPSVRAVETRASSLPARNSEQQNRSTGYPNKVVTTAPNERPAPPVWVKPSNWAEMVHTEAEYLRKRSAESQDPGGIDRLTPERIDEMEKKGVIIE